MFDTYPTTTEARRKAREYAEPMDQLINASDLNPNAENWSQVTAEEVDEAAWKQAEVTAEEHKQMRTLVDELAFRLWKDDLRRFSLDVIQDGMSDWELVSDHRIWPNEWDKHKLHDVMHQVFESPRKRAESPLGWYRQDAITHVRGGLFEGAKPQEQQ